MGHEIETLSRLMLPTARKNHKHHYKDIINTHNKLKIVIQYLFYDKTLNTSQSNIP